MECDGLGTLIAEFSGATNDLAYEIVFSKSNGLIEKNIVPGCYAWLESKIQRLKPQSRRWEIPKVQRLGALPQKGWQIDIFGVLFGHAGLSGNLPATHNDYR